MRDNSSLLRTLVGAGGVAMLWGEAMDRWPAGDAFPPFDRIEGMMLGLAIGDALGNPTESKNPGDRLRAHGEITDYQPGLLGTPSDDTQLSFWTLESLLDHDGLDPLALSEAFRHKQIFGIGRTVRQFLRNADLGASWEKRGVSSAGNGALMRIAPIVFPHLRRPAPGLWADAALAAMLTHNDPMAVSSAVAMTSILWHCLHATRQPAPEWWIDHFAGVLSSVEPETRYRQRIPEAVKMWKLSEFLDEEVRRAYHDGCTLLEAQRRWYSGAYLLETVPCVLFALMCHAGNPEEAILRMVNDTRDNDTIAAITGAVVGALHGKARLPERWVSRLSGRTAKADDGRVFEILARAGALYSTHHAT